MFTQWKKYVSHIYNLRNDIVTKETEEEFARVGINENLLSYIYYKTEERWSEHGWYKNLAFCHCIKDAYKENYNKVLIIYDDVKFLDRHIEKCLEETVDTLYTVLNPKDICEDCICIDRHIIEYLFHHFVSIQGNWYSDAMRSVEKNFIINYSSEWMCKHKIDYVIPYIDVYNPEWKKTFDGLKDRSISDTVLLKDFECDEEKLILHINNAKKYLTFINNIYIVTPDETHIPDEIKEDNLINIVTFQSIIQKKYMPVYNHDLIDMFICKIPNLCEHFIYTRPDIIPTSRTLRSEFFKWGNFCLSISDDTAITTQESNAIKLISDDFCCDIQGIRFNNMAQPLIKSACCHVNKLYKDDIKKSLSRYNQDKNISAYVYLLFEYMTGKYFKSSVEWENLYKDETVQYLQPIEENVDLYKSEKIIISMTSYPARIKYVRDVLESVIKQDVPRDLYHIVLVLAEPEFPNKEQDLPEDLVQCIIDNDIEIIWYYRNIRSHKKLMPTLKAYPNNSILIIDDDVIRPDGWLQMFIKDHIKYPNDIICGMGKSYIFNGIWYNLTNCKQTKSGTFCNYENIIYKTLRPANGFGGTLYPVNTFTDERFFNENLFMDLTPTSDEMWQWCFNIIENRTIRQSSIIYDYSKYIINGTQSLTTCLWKENDGKKYNDITNKLRQYFKDFNNKLSNLELSMNMFDVSSLKKYCVCTIVNDKFVPGLQVMIYSLLKHNCWFDGDIIILYSDKYSSLSENNMNLINKLYNKIKFVKIDDTKYENIDIKAHNIPEKFVSPLIKFEIFGFEEYDKLLYIDADTLIVNSIYNLINANNDIIAFTHEFDTILTPTLLQDIKFVKNQRLKSINNGVIMLNKNALNHNIITTLLNYILEYNRKCDWYQGCPDQDVMKKYFRECSLEVMVYPNKYNTIKRVFKNNIKKITDECIIHYVMNKPWIDNEDEYSYINNIWFKYQKELQTRNFDLRYEMYRSKLLQFVKLKYNIKLNLNNPLTIQDKINWLKLYDVNDNKTIAADKVLIHEYCKSKIDTDLCIPMFASYENYNQIRYNKLPEKFVMKCNHGSGWNKIIKDKSNMNVDDLYYWINRWLKLDWSLISGFEMQYQNIKPQILIEYFMDDENQKDSLLDYKFWCFNGEPKFYTINGDIGKGCYNHYTINGDLMELSRTDHPRDINIKYNKPLNFDKMIEYSKIFAKDFLFVRVDFYEINNKLYLGELTFTPGSGIFKYQNPQHNVDVGNLLKLPISK